MIQDEDKLSHRESEFSQAEIELGDRKDNDSQVVKSNSRQEQLVAKKTMSNTERLTRVKNNDDDQDVLQSSMSQHDDDKSDIQKAEDIKLVEKTMESQSIVVKQKSTLNQQRLSVMKIYEKDAENGLVSWTKMKHEMDSTHPRKVVDGKLQVYPCCSTRMGCLGCGKKSRQSEMYAELGLGVTLYFQVLKALIWYFFIMSIITLPTIMTFALGNQSDSFQDASLTTYFSMATLGNLGEDDIVCNQANVTTVESNMTLLCSYGTISTLTVLGLQAANQEQYTCDSSSNDFGFQYDEACTYNATNVNDTQFYSVFQSQCVNQTSCSLEINNSTLGSSCSSEIDNRISDPATYGFPNIILVADCLEPNLVLPYSGAQVERGQLGVIVVMIDVVVMLALIFMIQILSTSIKRQARDYNQNNLEMQDFALKLKNFPPQAKYQTLDDLKVVLWNQIETQLNNMDPLDEHAKEKKCESHNEVSNIYFGKKDYGALDYLQNIQAYIKEVELIQERMKREKGEKALKNLEEVKKKYMDKIDKNGEEYQKYRQKKRNESMKCAYVVFKSTEARNKFKKAYDIGPCARFWKSLCCCRFKFYRDMKFLGKYFYKVSDANEPDLILWQNLGVSQKARYMRHAFVFFIDILILAACVIAALYAQQQQQVADDFSPIITCPEAPTDPTEAEAYYDQLYIDAYNDQLQPQDLRVGTMHCYCYDQSFIDPTGFIYTEFPDGELYCEDWFYSYSKTLFFTYGMSFIIVFLNGVSQIIMKALVKVQKEQSVIEETYSTTISMFVLTFINTAIVLLIVNINLGINTFGIPVFQGQYADFDVNWYYNIGSTISMTMFYNIFSPHVFNAMYNMMDCFKRCRDRSCTFNSKKTKQVLQEDYENINKGAVFLFEYRYSQVLTSVFITLMYSAGIPALYLIAFLTMFSSYWVDKYFILNFYRRPVKYDEKLQLYILGLFKYAIMLHFGIGLIMLSNSKILSSEEFDEENLTIDGVDTTQYSDLIAQTLGQRYDQTHVIIFIVFNLFFVLLYAAYLFLWPIYKKTIKALLKKCFSDDDEKEVEYSDDFLRQINLAYLYKEKIKTKDEIHFYKDKEAKGEFNNELLDSKALNDYITRLTKKQVELFEILEEYEDIMGVNEGEQDQRVDILLQKQFELQEKLNKIEKSDKETYQRIVSVIQTYDIKDKQDYQGIHDLQAHLDTHGLVKASQTLEEHGFFKLNE